MAESAPLLEAGAAQLAARRARRFAAATLVTLAVVAVSAGSRARTPTRLARADVAWTVGVSNQSADGSVEWRARDDDVKTKKGDDDVKTSGGGPGSDDANEEHDDIGDTQTRHNHVDSGGDDDRAKSTRWRPLNATATADDGNWTRSEGSDSPHLIFFYIDDQGFNDMGPNSTDLWWATPTILGLHSTGGIWLDNYYGQHICTPSRASLLTGLYPSHNGMQHSMISGNVMWGLPLQYKLMPEYLKDTAGYRTHMVGKWHLGHFSLAHTPKQRGFDTFFGFFSGYESYYGHVSEVSAGCMNYDWGCWYDLRNEGEPVKSGDYGPYMMMDTVDALIESHANENDPTAHPFFLCERARPRNTSPRSPSSLPLSLSLSLSLSRPLSPSAPRRGARLTHTRSRRRIALTRARAGTTRCRSYTSRSSRRRTSCSIRSGPIASPSSITRTVRRLAG